MRTIHAILPVLLVAACTDPAPAMPASLAGEWLADGYSCEGAEPAERLALSVQGQVVTATKISGDACIKAGQVSWQGEFADGKITGTFRFAPPGAASVSEQDAVFTVNDDGTITGSNLTLKRAN